MFDTAYVLVSASGQPVLILPETLPQGDTFLDIVAGGIDIGVDGEVIGRIREMEDTTLAMIGLQEEIGMATAHNDQLPDAIEYVARVSDKRF